MSLSPLVSVLIVAGAVLALAALAVAFLVLRDPSGARRRIESLFRRPPPPPRTAGDEHYYRPYWSR